MRKIKVAKKTVSAALLLTKCKVSCNTLPLLPLLLPAGPESLHELVLTVRWGGPRGTIPSVTSPPSIRQLTPKNDAALAGEDHRITESQRITEW